MKLNKYQTVLAIGSCALLFSGLAKSHAEEKAGISGPRALELLLAGNQRFVAGQPKRAHQDMARLSEVAKGQHPFAIIVGCSDSRVPAEIVFDQGLGDLFGVRTAGHVMGDATLGTIEYGVEHLGANLIVVMGHSRCGAVDAAVKGGHAPRHVDSLVNAIAPAVKSVKGEKGPLLYNSVLANVRMVVSELRTSHPVLSERVEKGSLKIVGAYYDLDSGKVNIVPVSPTQVSKWQHAPHHESWYQDR